MCINHTYSSKAERALDNPSLLSFSIEKIFRFAPDRPICSALEHVCCLDTSQSKDVSRKVISFTVYQSLG